MSANPNATLGRTFPASARHPGRDGMTTPSPTTRKATPMTDTQPTETITDPALIRATDEPDERNTTIVGMVDDLGRPATIYTPPEVLRRDPARWPTPAEFVSEWEQHSPERRLYLAERILSDAQKVERLDEAIDRARWERAQAEDAETEATARAESAEAEVGTLRDTLARRTDSHTQLVRENEALRAKVAEVEAKRDEFADLLARALPAVAALARVEALGDSNPDHADTCGSMLTPGAGYPCSCWQADLRAALATTGEGQ